MVGHENHDRVIELAGFFQGNDHATDLFVDQLNHRVIGGDDLLLVAVSHPSNVIAAWVVVGEFTVELLIGSLSFELARFLLGQWQLLGAVMGKEIYRRIEGVVRGKTVIAEKPRLTFLFVNELDRLFGAPCGLVVFFRDAVLDVICRWSAVELLPRGAFVLQPFRVGILWPIRLGVV